MPTKSKRILNTIKTYRMSPNLACKLNAYSGSKLPPIPDECCHPFHFKAATNSG
ncbi:MAG: hypothetical protein RIS10_391 [Pseudomonadota bacterium]